MIRQPALFHLFLLHLLYQAVQGQYPTVCAENATQNDGTCCPSLTIDSAPCGYPTGGVCTSTKRPGTFSNACHCFGNFFGIACDECIYGYDSSNGCIEKLPLLSRKDIAEAQGDELENLERAVNLSLAVQAPFVVPDRLGEQAQAATWMDYFGYLYQFLYAMAMGPGFLTWNRLFILTVESVFGELSNVTTAMPFWNWTSEASTKALMKMDSDHEEFRNCSLPKLEEVDRCLSLAEFDPDPFEISEQSQNRSFRNCIHELHAQILHCLDASAIGPFSVNPIPYLLHMTFLDKIFSVWMARWLPNILAYPQDSKFPGQARYDNIEPFYPPVTHAVMFSDKATLGYTYADEAADGSSPPNDALWLVGVILSAIAAVLVVVLVITAQFKVGDGRRKNEERSVVQES